MAATATSVSHYFFEAKPLWTGTIAAGGVSSDSTGTIPLTAATNLDNGDAYIVRINRVDSNSVKQPADETEVLIGELSGTNLINSTRAVEGTAAAWGAGTVVEILFTAAHWNKLVAGLGVSHNPDGTMITSLPLTTPKITTSINDANGNEVIKTPATASAVNEVTITNAATGNDPSISATGGDTNIDLEIKGKGTGGVKIGTGTVSVTDVLDEDTMSSDSAVKLATQQSIKAYVDSQTSGKSQFYRNILINGGFDIWQRQITFTPNDDVYTADRWNALTETNGAWTIARDTDVPAALGFKYSAKFTNVTLNNQVAIVQFIENVDSMKLDDQAVSLSFYAKTNSTEIANLRAAVLSWSSTADAVTSDVIDTWASDGTDPTFAANWTKENTPANLALTSSWQRFTIENITIDTASMANIAVVIWLDDGTIAANDDFYITGVQLNQGATALTWNPKGFSEELTACKRFYEHNYPYGTFPASSGGANAINYMGTVGGSQAHGDKYEVEKRVDVTPTIYSTAGTSGNVTRAFVGDVAASADASGSNTKRFFISHTAVDGSQYQFFYVANAEL